MNKQFKIYGAIIGLVTALYIGLAIKDQVYSPTTWPENAALSYLQRDGNIDQLLADRFDRQEFIGTWTLVNFWASWCTACDQELEVMQRLQQQWVGRETRVLGVVTNDKVNDVLRSEKLQRRPYDHLIDANDTLYRAFNLQGLPTTLIVNPQGEVVGKFEGVIQPRDEMALLNRLGRRKS